MGCGHCGLLRGFGGKKRKLGEKQKKKDVSECLIYQMFAFSSAKSRICSVGGSG